MPQEIAQDPQWAEIPQLRQMRNPLMRNNIQVQDGVTFGIEYEATNIRLENLDRSLFDNFNREHDASIETPTTRLGEISVIDDRGLLPKDRILGGGSHVGVELVSGILDGSSENTHRMLQSFCSHLQCAGETGGNERAGIHFHVSSPISLRIVKNMVALAAHLEQVFFYVGGMGYPFRGEKNQAAYCRPITKWGPTIIRYGDAKVQTYSVEKLLTATSLEEFFDMYGGINVASPPNKYFPTRYGWFTLFPLITGKKTVEFRIFNQTINPEYIWAALNLCLTFVEVCMGRENLTKLPQNSIYDEHNIDTVYRTLDAFCDKYEFNPRLWKVLRLIIRNTPEINMEKKYFYTHLGSEKFSARYNVTTPIVLKPGESVSNLNVVDIHRLRGER